MTDPKTASSVPPRDLRLGAFAYGGDYNPEQWPESTWLDDVRLMREAGVNLVTLPVFGWSRLEPSPGVFEFDWLDRVLDLLWDHGIAIDLATATATPPPWMVRQHPDMLPVDGDGHRLEFGSRQSYCPSSPLWRSEVARLAQMMADRYGRHPGLALWHASNEYGDHIVSCYCEESARAFRHWLTDRYASIAQLNESWGTSVWGQVYRSWDEINPPRRAPGPINPAQVLDFKRFSSDELLGLFRIEVDVLRSATPDIPITTNFMSLFSELDYWKFAELEDIVTDDAYPDPAEDSLDAAALSYSLMRGLKHGRPWILLEQAPSAVSWRAVNVPKSPGQMRLMSLQAVAHGADGVMSFQWRQARFGPERFHSAMLGHREARSRTFREAAAFGAELTKLEPLRGTSVRSQIGLVVDWDSWWASSAADSLPSTKLQWLNQARRWATALRALGHTVDIVRADGTNPSAPPDAESFHGPFGVYQAIVVPGAYLLDEADAAVWQRYVHDGGQLVVGPFSGVVDPNEHVFAGGAPGPLRDLLGVEVDEFWPIADGHRFAVEMSENGESIHAETWAEWLEPAADTTVLATYSDGPLTGQPAVTEARRGAGNATYISAVLSVADLSRVLIRPLTAAGIGTRRAVVVVRGDAGLIEAVTRSSTTTDFTFVLNHADEPALVDIGDAGTDLLTGTAVAGSTDLPAFGALVIARKALAEFPSPGGTK